MMSTRTYMITLTLAALLFFVILWQRPEVAPAPAPDAVVWVGEWCSPIDIALNFNNCGDD